MGMGQVYNSSQNLDNKEPSMNGGSMRKPSKVLIFLILLPSLLSVSIAQDTLTPGQSLNDSTTLVSSGGNFRLGFFSPGNSKNRYLGIWYNKISVRTYVWVANRENPLSDSTGILSVSNNGSLILANVTGSVFLSTPATNVGTPAAQLLDTGNLVALDATGDYSWQSFDHPTDIVLPGLNGRRDLQTGLNRILTSWKSNNDPAPGDYSIVFDIHGVPQIFKMVGPVREWRSGPWVGRKFSGIPDMGTLDNMTFNFMANPSEVYYSFHMFNQSIISKIMLNQSGTLERHVWIEGSSLWSVFWFAPKDQCDLYSKCGPNGVCDTNDSPICKCLPGFVPKSWYAWNMRDGTDGCVRETELDCPNGTDGFEMVTGLKLPDTAIATVDMSMALDDCRIACLGNCSCTGYSSADVSGGNGCIFWFSELTDIRVFTSGGQDLFVRMAVDYLGSAIPSDQSRKNLVTTIFAVPVVLEPLLLLLGLIVYYAWKRLKTKKRGLFSTTTTRFIKDKNEDSRTEDFELPLFDMVTIVAATDNFSSENKIGQGGFGSVYKGRLVEGQDIAVKRLSKTSMQGIDEFKNEVSLIAKLQHRNLVRLLGCCIKGQERLLIYEYMSNNSLDAFLFDKSKRAQLNWQMRYFIIVGIARGLLYLHQDSRLRIIHRDLKASNILLDKEMNPKISDFGMARIFEGDETEANTQKVVGTYGYMSPEYAMDGIFSVKSDVFSFGVIVLEIISGKKNRGICYSASQNLLSNAWNLWKEGNGLELVDQSIGYSYPIAEAMRCIKIGLLCLQERPDERPTMSSVVVMLASDNTSLPQPRKPGFVLTSGPLEVVHQDSNTE